MPQIDRSTKKAFLFSNAYKVILKSESEHLVRFRNYELVVHWNANKESIYVFNNVNKKRVERNEGGKRERERDKCNVNTLKLTQEQHNM